MASAATVLLAAIAGGQQTSPLRQPPRMPPEIMARSRPAVSPTLELDNQQLQVMRYALDPGDRWIVASNSLLVAITNLTIEYPSDVQRLVVGQTRLGHVGPQPGIHPVQIPCDSAQAQLKIL